MRILHFYKTAYPDTTGGTEQVIHQLARGGMKYGLTTDVLSLTNERSYSSIEIDTYTLHRVNLDFEIASTGFSLDAISQFSQLSEKSDVIHYHFPWPFMDLVHFLSNVKKPTVVTYHSDIIRQQFLLSMYRPLKWKFLASVDHIVATSPNYLATSEVLSRYSDKVSVIPIGLDKESYQTPSAEKLSYWQKRIGDKFFLFIGVIRYYKGLHILIEASQGVDYPIVIVGAGPIESELKKQSEKLGLRNIHFLGFLPDEDKNALLMLCYAVVFPSNMRSEAFGISLLEGAMFGKPMISSEIGTGTTFVNVGGETGLVVPPSDPDSLRDAMTFLWNYPDIAEKLGKNALARYWENFTADQMLASYVDLYKKLVR